MTEQNLTDLLARAAEPILVNPPPLDEMLSRTRRVRRRRAVVLITASSAAVVLIVGGITELSGPDPTNQQRNPGAASTPSDGTTASPGQGNPGATALVGGWMVRSLIGPNGQSALPSAYAGQVELTFKDGQLTGTTGCNTVFGTYQQGGARGQDLVFPPNQLGSTDVGCRDEPPLTTRLIDVRHVTGSGDVRYLRAANWMTIAMLQAVTASSTPSSPSAHGDLTGQEYAFALDLARQETRKEDAYVSSVTVTVGRGRVTDSNVGYPCESGRLLHIKLIGTFPHIATTGHPLEPGSPPADFTVRAVLLTADAVSGRACLIGVQTGHPEPEPGSVSLPLG